MNRLQKRYAILNAAGIENDLELPELCLRFRMSLNDSGDSLSDKSQTAYYNYLRCVIDTWEDEYQKDYGELMFDLAVKNLVNATIQLYVLRILEKEMKESN
jgi:hypothetical protein